MPESASNLSGTVSTPPQSSHGEAVTTAREQTSSAAQFNPTSEIEADDWGTDSAYGDDDDDAESTASITSSILRYREENGRTYHAYKVCQGQ